MNILLTGDPHVGKSTILQKLVDSIENKRGFITRELLGEHERTGFELISDDGATSLLASVESNSEIRVSRYGVEVESLNSFAGSIKPFKNGDILYIDEIGQMELYSSVFKDLVAKYLEADNLFIGTISQVYEDDFTRSILSRSDVELVRLSFENRDTIYEGLKTRVAKFVH
jgi:nucleoside-triphosphatase